MTDLNCVVEKASNDESFREHLLAHPARACQEAGYCLPEGVTLLVHQDTSSKRHLVLNDICQFTHIPEVAKVAERANVDPEFRSKLKQDPSDAIFDELGLALPSSVELVILENSSLTLHLVLESVELDDLTLAHVAGGKLAGSPAASSGGKGSPTPAKSSPAPAKSSNPTFYPPGALMIPTSPNFGATPPNINAKVPSGLLPSKPASNDPVVPGSLSIAGLTPLN